MLINREKPQQPMVARASCHVILAAIFGLIMTGPASAQEIPSLVPAPASIKMGSGMFLLNKQSSISWTDDEQAQNSVEIFRKKIKSLTGIELHKGTDQNASIQVELNKKANPKLGIEGYALRSAQDRITLNANTPAGIFYGLQTIEQLLSISEQSDTQGSAGYTIPALTIEDYPRFSWRGIMLDVSRHFFSKEYVKEYIDQLAHYKFNRLHLHLSDDNGWRLEIKSLPKLTEIGAWRVPRTGTFGSHDDPKPGEAATDGGFYTHEDIREIVHYAKERFIEILPEIDVPGHSMAAIASYPELSVTKNPNIKVNPGTNFSTWFGNGKFEMHIDNTLNPTDDKVYDFLDKVFTEVSMLFPFEYIHMGGDECYKGYWERDPTVQAFMKKKNIPNMDALQNYFTNRVHKIITSKNKKMIGWDEILEGGSLPKDVAVMSWRGVKGGIKAAQDKHKVVMSPSPNYYLDMVQGEPSVEPKVYNTARLVDVYQMDILPKGIDSSYVLGGQANLWTEHVTTTPQIEYMTYPRAFAVAENLWSPPINKDWDNFRGRVENQFDRLEALGINYSPSIFDPIIKVKKEKDGRYTVSFVTEAQQLDIFYTLDNTIPNHYYSKYTEPITLPSGTDMLRLITYRNGKRMGRLISLTIEELQKRAR